MGTSCMSACRHSIYPAFWQMAGHHECLRCVAAVTCRVCVALHTAYTPPEGCHRRPLLTELMGVHVSRCPCDFTMRMFACCSQQLDFHHPCTPLCCGVAYADEAQLEAGCRASRAPLWCLWLGRRCPWKGARSSAAAAALPQALLHPPRSPPELPGPQHSARQPGLSTPAVILMHSACSVQPTHLVITLINGYVINQLTQPYEHVQVPAWD